MAGTIGFSIPQHRKPGGLMKFIVSLMITLMTLQVARASDRELVVGGWLYLPKIRPSEGVIRHKAYLTENTQQKIYDCSADINISSHSLVGKCVLIDGFQSILPPSKSVTTYLAMQTREAPSVTVNPAIWQLDNSTGKLQFCALDAAVKPTCIDMAP
jgi:hypothetical protein